MRRYFFRLLGLALIGFPLTVQAQSANSQGATIQVDIFSGPISVFTENALNFGTLLAGSGTSTVALTSPNAGKFRVQGRRNTNTNITLTPPAVLTNGAASIPFTWQAAKNEDEDNAAAGTTAVGATHVLRLRYKVSAQVGNAWLFIHGSIDASNATLPGGQYTGVFTVTASYN